MVQPILKGRCGNQMFQIAAAIGYAETHRMDFFVPGQTADPDKWPVYFPHFPTAGKREVITARIFTENGFGYQELPAAENLFLDGYFQSEKYFAHCASRVRNAFNTQWHYVPKHSVSIHVRRGDYLLHPGHHPVLGFDYYEEAIKLFLKEDSLTHFEVFSDDMDWCIAQFNSINFPKATFNYNWHDAPNAIETAHQDLGKMSTCTHHIIANSSFSWWGAWLDGKPNKIVVAPKQWFGPALVHLDTSDLLPKSWIKL